MSKPSIEELLAFSVKDLKKKPEREPLNHRREFVTHKGNQYSQQFISFLNYEGVPLNTETITHFYGVTKLPVGPTIGLQVLHTHAANEFCSTPLGCHVRLSCRVQDTSLHGWWKSKWQPIYEGIEWQSQDNSKQEIKSEELVPEKNTTSNTGSTLDIRFN